MTTEEMKRSLMRPIKVVRVMKMCLKPSNISFTNEKQIFLEMDDICH